MPILDDARAELDSVGGKRRLARALRAHPDFVFQESMRGVLRRIDHWLNPDNPKRFPMEAIEMHLEITGGDLLMPRLEAAAARGRAARAEQRLAELEREAKRPARTRVLAVRRLSEKGQRETG